MRHPILRLLASWALGASLAGCTTTYQPGRPPVTTLDDPLGNHVVFAPPPPAIEPPLRVPASDTLPPPAMPRAGGTYSGWATIVGAPQGACASEMRVANFRVVATRVRYGRFAGRITPDGGLEMFSEPPPSPAGSAAHISRDRCPSPDASRRTAATT